VYANKAYAAENLDRNYRNRNIYILSDSQASIKALDSYQINSKLVWDCHQPLVQLAKYNRVQLIWVPGHEDIVGNETADQLARTGSEHPFIGPELACGISIGVAKKVVRDWTNRDMYVYIYLCPLVMLCGVNDGVLLRLASCALTEGGTTP
jgi:hypothetical protein